MTANVFFNHIGISINKPSDINGLPFEKKDCICLAKRTLGKAIKKYKNKGIAES